MCNNQCACCGDAGIFGEDNVGSFTSYVPVTVNYSVQSGSASNGNGGFPYGNFSGSCAADFAASVDNNYQSYCGDRCGCHSCCRRCW